VVCRKGPHGRHRVAGQSHRLGHSQLTRHTVTVRRRRDGLEAGAYRTLSEGEHQRVKGVGGGMRPTVDPVMGDSAVLGAAHNLGLRAGSANAVDALPANTTGFHDATGSVWQWCSDHFAALPGYKVHPMYDDFSTPCFDGQHNIIMGGSWVSAGDLASVFARFHFRPHFFQVCNPRPQPATQRPNQTHEEPL
jgi:formylglycine-generating enzyme required for sulfatase activity